jgi:hypothetical protein
MADYENLGHLSGCAHRWHPNATIDCACPVGNATHPDPHGMRKCPCCRRALEIGTQGDFCSVACRYHHEREFCACFASGSME